MELKLSNLKEIKQTVDRFPAFDVEAVRKNTREHPQWVAFGTGNIFRAYIARINQDLLNRGLTDTGIIAIAAFNNGSLEKIFEPVDNLSVAVTLNRDGDFETELIANLAEVFYITEHYERAKEIFTDPGLQMASFTITEKGYNIFDATGKADPSILAQVGKPYEEVSHLMVHTLHLLKERFDADAKPLTLVSMDNVSKNGEILSQALVTLAEYGKEKGVFSEDFLQYLKDDEKISTPWTVIDKITPVPSAEVEAYLEKIGFDGLKRIERENRAPLAAFVNTEEAEYLVMEDHFVNGRAPFEKVGVYMTDRETVNKVETMKVTTSLNPLHTALAIFGSLLSIPRISDCMEDKDLFTLVRRLAYDEALPVVVNPGIIRPDAFVEEVLTVRFPNPYLPDSPSRIATDTSQKIAIRFGKTLTTYLERDLHPENLTYIPLVLAGWLRYLFGVDDNGELMPLSPDPRMDELKEKLVGISLGHFERTKGLEELLLNEQIFGVNLKEAGLFEKTLTFFEEMTEGKGAVRNTLEKALEV